MTSEVHVPVDRMQTHLFPSVDTFLDALVVPSFSSFGIRARERLGRHDPAWSTIPVDALAGKSIVITGANSGIGLAAARTMANHGAELVLVARNPERGATARGLIEAESAASVHLEIADMSALSDVRALGRRISERGSSIHALVQNAGALLPNRQDTSDGLEATFATHVVGPTLLTRELLPVLRGGGRVITVSSGGMYTQRLEVDDLVDPPSYRGSVAYAQAKRAQVVLNELWAERVEPHDVAFHCMHPGWVDTPGVEQSLPTFRRIVGRGLRTPEEGADTVVWLVATRDAEPRSGGFWLDRRARTTHKLPWTVESPSDRERLWDLVTSLTGGHDLTSTT